ncbi:MAG: IclR family transcriptional regulator [Anaerolineae bacterium]
MDGIQSLARGLHILDLIANSGRSWSVTELAHALQVDKSSASRLVRTLVNYGYLQTEPGTRRYTLGKRLYHIGWQVLNLMPIRQKARAYLHRLVQDTGECAHTAVFAENKALVIDDVETETTLRVVSGTGRMIPLHCTAVGKALLAFAEVPLPQQLQAFTPRTITSKDQLEAHLSETFQRGYAFDDEEFDEGIRCIAAPVYNYMGIAIAVIGISGPKVRLQDDKLGDLASTVMRAAHELSVELGYVGERTCHEEIN